MILDTVELPAGRLRVIDPEQAHEPHAGQEVGFSGWLGLLWALYEVTAQPGDAPRPAMTLSWLAAQACSRRPL